MTAPDSIISRLRAIKNLMSDPSATRGERENASLLFSKLMDKHGLTEKDLLDEKTDIVKFDIANEFEKMLICQIVYKLTGDKEVGFWTRNPHNGRRTTKNVWFELTKLEAKEAGLLYHHYRKSLQKEMLKLFSAFVQSNSIFPETSEKVDGKKLSPEEPKNCWRSSPL